MNEHSHGTGVLNDLVPLARDLRHDIPEVSEAIGVAILMTGGPATVYGPRALAAYKEFANESSQT